MEDENPINFTKTHFFQQHYNPEFQANPRNKGKSCSHFFLKLLFIALFLCLLPLFPSDPPEFISHTVFAKSWELIHLLIIGIALSYGVFCRRKTAQIPPKTQISQPNVANILHHSSIFDYEEGNPSWVSNKNVIPTQSFNLSHYRTEPFVELRRETGNLFDEKPLGLPVRSLRSRVVDSDSDVEEEECASDCDSDSDLSDNNSSYLSRSGIVENLEGSMGSFRPSTIPCNSQSTRADFFMDDSSRFQAKQLQPESFMSSAPEASSCQKFSGFCSWLPESPNMDIENSWGGDPFYMPFSNFTQVNDLNMVGVPNLENPANFAMPSAAAVVPTSVPFSAIEFASGSRTYNHENVHWGNPNFGGGYLNMENCGFFMPSPAVRSPTQVSPSDLASRSRRYNHGIENWSDSSILQNGAWGGENANNFTPPAAFPSSMPAFASSIQPPKVAEFCHGSSLTRMDEMSSENNAALGMEITNKFVPSPEFHPPMPASAGTSASVIASKLAGFNHESFVRRMDEMRSENNNVAKGDENTNIFVPSTGIFPSMTASTDAFDSPVQASKTAEFNLGSSVNRMDEIRSENSNVALSAENTNMLMPSAGSSPSEPPYANDFATSDKASKTAKFNHGFSLKRKDDLRSDINKAALSGETTNSFMPKAAFSPSVPASADEFASSVKASKNEKFNHGIFLKEEDDRRSERKNAALTGETTNITNPTAAFASSVPASSDDFASSVKTSKTAKSNHGSSLKKTNEMRSENNNVAMKSFPDEINSNMLCFDGTLAGGKSPKLQNGKLGVEKPNFLMNTPEVLTSVSSPINEFASSIKASRSARSTHEASSKEDEERSENDNVESFRAETDAFTPHSVDPLSFPAPRADFFIKKTEQRSMPEKWDSGCFEIPLSENNDMGDILLESPSPLLSDSSEAPSSAGSSTRVSCHEQGTPVNEVEEYVPWSAPMNNSEIENVIEDVLVENDSYKPSTPSPPLQIQTRRNDLVASSVESSSRALGNQSVLNNDNDDKGSPPTPDKRKTLSRASHSRRFSCGSFFDRDLRKSFKGEAKEEQRKTKGEHQFAKGGKCGGWDCLKLDVKPTMSKSSLKGKSVRTIRPKETAHDPQKNNLIEFKLEENKEGSTVTNGGDRKAEKPETVVIQIGISEKRSNSNGRTRQKLQGSGETSIIVGLSSKQNSNGKAAVPHDEVKEGNDSEIDRKADEFIAKFKEQIRLQKVAPIKLQEVAPRVELSRQQKSLYQT